MLKNQKGGDSIQRSDSIPELETIYRKYWDHARQCVNERVQFTSIYIVAVAAILAFIAQIESKSANLTPVLLLSSFGLILSVIGFMVVISLSFGYAHYIGDITMILYYWDKMEFYRHPKKPATFRDVHRLPFEFTIALFGVLFLFYLSQTRDILAPFYENLIWPLVVFIIIFFHIEALYRWRWKKYAVECSRFKEALQNDFEGIYRDDWENWFKKPNARERIIEKAG